MFVMTIVFYIALRKLTIPSTNEDVEESGTSSLNVPTEPADEDGYTPEQYVILKRTGKYCFCFEKFSNSSATH